MEAPVLEANAILESIKVLRGQAVVSCAFVSNSGTALYDDGSSGTHVGLLTCLMFEAPVIKAPFRFLQVDRVMDRFPCAEMSHSYERLLHRRSSVISPNR